MKKGFVFFLLVACVATSIANSNVTADRYEGKVTIYFEKDTSDSKDKPNKPINRDIVSSQQPKDQPKLPKTGQMITSMMVLLSGIIVILIVSMLYVMSKKREEEL